MAFSRVVAPETLAQGEDLTRAMTRIGMAFGSPVATTAETEPNLEDTLVAASLEGMGGDLRTLAVLVTWIGVHDARIHADRLIRLLRTIPAPRVRAFWAAIAQWLEKDRRFARLVGLHRGPRIDLLERGTAFHVRRRGEDARFEGSALRVPAGVLRDRPGDVLTPAELARHHATYRQRVQQGPSYRADMWATLELEPALTPAELARRTYGSFATAWEVKRDWELLAA